MLALPIFQVYLEFYIPYLSRIILIHLTNDMDSLYLTLCVPYLLSTR
ncbi:hypothetical protein VCRA2123E342_30572 [Vibrio crassostreae]|nr:hypothetical protein VCRA2123E342_30572 [Vibrio crassostreae]